MLVFESHVNVDRRDEIEFSILIFQFIFKLGKGFSEQFPKLQCPDVNDRTIEEFVLIRQAFRGRKPLVLIFYVWQVLLIAGDQVKARSKDVAWDLASQVGLEEARHVIPLHHVDFEIVYPLVEQQLIALDKELVA